MKRIKTIAAAACMTICSESAFAAQAQIVPVGFGADRNGSWLAGAVAGYNWQRGAFVLGFEGDLQGTGLRSEVTGTFTTPNINNNVIFPSADAVARVDWYGTARARFGWATGSFLFYGTAGVAYGNVSVSDNYNLGTVGQTAGVPTLNSQISGVRAGWVAGAGAEYLITPSLSVNFEYQYVDLGYVTLAGISGPPPLQTVTSPSATLHAQFQAVTLGMSWHFGGPSGPNAALASMVTKAAPPPPSDPWAGLYVGGRAGGAWGNNLGVTPSLRIQPPT